MDANKKQIVDLNLIYQFAGDDKSVVDELVEVFLRQTPMILEFLQAALGEQDWEEVSKSAHKLKPSLGTMGMDAEKELAIEIEKDCKSGETALVKNKIDVLVNRCLLAMNELKSHSTES